MWKRPEEITAHNQSQGRDQFDPAQWIHTFVAEVETIWLEGDRVILAGCCESVSVKREDVIAWRELPGREGRASTYEVRMKKGADAIAQRAVKVSREQPRCPRCGRGWDGLPAARGRDGEGGGGGGDREGGHGCGEMHGHRGHHGHGHHGHGHGEMHGHHGHGEMHGQNAQSHHHDGGEHEHE